MFEECGVSSQSRGTWSARELLHVAVELDDQVLLRDPDVGEDRRRDAVAARAPDHPAAVLREVVEQEPHLADVAQLEREVVEVRLAPSRASHGRGGRRSVQPDALVAEPVGEPEAELVDVERCKPLHVLRSGRSRGRASSDGRPAARSRAGPTSGKTLVARRPGDELDAVAVRVGQVERGRAAAGRSSTSLERVDRRSRRARAPSPHGRTPAVRRTGSARASSPRRRSAR